MGRQAGAMIAYVKHAMKARSKYHIHSPFVYGFYKDILHDSQMYSQYRVVNRLRKELMTVSRFIKRKDLGAGGKEFPNDQRFVRVKDVVHHSSVTRKHGEFLFRLVHHYNPRNILELGTSVGLSSIYFALAAPESRIITIEGCIDSANLARENMEKSGVRNVTVVTGNFDDKLGAALREMAVVDMVYFDGNHKKEPTLAYFGACLPHTHPGTIFIFDDIHWSAGMEEAWNTIRAHPGVKVSIDLYHMGIVFFKDELSKEDYTLFF
ncbi:MAG TPA: class I SAM-dependent methyltransferase [Bacteroidales bacterium]|nr:class I SAM-dependent methyltransferase [Bacteroidales bacterium]